jgi:pre-mRNA-processing factor 17
MENLTAYESEEEVRGDRSVQKVDYKEINAAPDIVAIEEPICKLEGEKFMYTNVKYSDLVKNHKEDDQKGRRGNVESYAVSDIQFETERNSFETLRNLEENSHLIGGEKKKIRKRNAQGKASDVHNFMGPWAHYEGDTINLDDYVEEQPVEENIRKYKKGNIITSPDDVVIEKTIFHGKNEFDYLGRTYIVPPKDQGIDLSRNPEDHECFAPKKLIHTYIGHSKGVNSMQLFPQSGHLILSGSIDTKVKLWDVYHERRCLRTFLGHSLPVTEVCFSPFSGLSFLSLSQDGFIKLWDTESGACLSKFSNKNKRNNDVLSTPLTVKFNDSKPNEFIAGYSDGKIIQFDIKSGRKIQEYDNHVGSINSITFLNDTSTFVSTGDDRSLKLWEYGIPVVVRQVVEADFNVQLPILKNVAKHPNGKYLAYQSADLSHEMAIINTKDFIRSSKRSIKGHLLAGYKCQQSFSPDGQFLASGDANGCLFVWDWKSSKIVRKIQAHEQVVTACEWHPQETSKIITCSWDGTLKLFD